MDEYTVCAFQWCQKWVALKKEDVQVEKISKMFHVVCLPECYTWWHVQKERGVRAEWHDKNDKKQNKQMKMKKNFNFTCYFVFVSSPLFVSYLTFLIFFLFYPLLLL